MVHRDDSRGGEGVTGGREVLCRAERERERERERRIGWIMTMLLGTT
jgi:hypothetical protein